MIYQETQSGVIQSKYNKLIIKNYQDFLHDKTLDTGDVSQRNNHLQNHRSQQFARKQKTPIRNKNHGYEQFKAGNQVKVIGRSQHNQGSYKPSGLNYHKSISQAERNDIIGLSMKIQSKSKQQRLGAAKKHNRNQYERFQQSKEDSSIFDTNLGKYEIDGNHFGSKKSSGFVLNNIETGGKNTSKAIQVSGNQLGQHEKAYRSRELLREQQYRQNGRRAIPLKVHDFTKEQSKGVLDTETPSVLQNKVLQQGYLPEKYRLFQGKILQKSVNEYRNPKLRGTLSKDVSKSQGDRNPGDRSTLQLRMSTPVIQQDSIDTNDSQEAYGQHESVPNIQVGNTSQLTQKNTDSGQIRDLVINFRDREPTAIDGQTNTTGGYPVPGSMGTFNQKKNSQNSAASQQRPYKSSYNNTNTQSTLSQPQQRAKSIETKKRKKLQNPLFATNYRGDHSVDNTHEIEGLTQNLTQGAISQSSLPKNLHSGEYQSGQKILKNNHFSLNKHSGITQVHGSAIEAIAETNAQEGQLLKTSSVDEAVNQQPFSSQRFVNNELIIRNEGGKYTHTQKAQNQAVQNFQFSDSQAQSISQNASIERMANANAFDVFENQDSSMNIVNAGFSQRVPDPFDSTRNQMTTNVQQLQKTKFMSQMETRKTPDISHGPGGVIDINQLLSAGHSQQNNGLANLAAGRFPTAMGTVSYDNPVGFYMNHMKNKIDNQHFQSGNYISIQSRNDAKQSVFDKNDINFTTLGTQKTFKQGRLSMTHEMKNLITEATAAKTDDIRGFHSLKNSKSIDNLDRKKVFIGELKIGQFKNQKGKLQHQETMVNVPNQKLIRNNSTMTTNNASASNNMPHFGKRTKRSVPTHATGTMSATKGSNIDIKDLAEMSQNPNSINLNKRLANQGLYSSFQTGSKETSQNKLPEFGKQQKPASKPDKQIKQLYYGYQYDQHLNIREALHGTPERPHITAFNKRKTLRQIQLDMQQRELNAVSGLSQASGQYGDDYNPLRQDKAKAIHNKLNNQNAPIENGSILHNQMTLSGSTLMVDKLSGMTNAENIQVIQDTIKARGGPDEVHFGLVDQAGIVFENAKDMNANLFTGAINKISQVYGMNQDSTLIESYQPVKMEIPKINAKFYRIPVQGKKAPAVVEAYFPASHGHDFRLYWSQTQRYPCETPTECEGAFTNGEKTMYLNPAGESSFSKEFVYIGFYSKNGFNASFAVGFGRNCEASLRHVLIAAADNKEYRHTKKTKINIDDITSEMSSKGFAEIEEQQHISRTDQLKLWKLKTKQTVKKLMNNDIERGVYFNKCNEIKDQQNAKAMALRQAVQQKEQESQIKMKTSQILNSLFGKPRSPVSADMGTDSASKFGGEQYQQLMQNKFQQQFDKQQEYVSEQDYFLKQQTFKSYQDKERQCQQLEQYKYNVFLTIKNQVLKQVKDQSVDEKIAVLRKHKLARTHVILIKISKRIKQLWLKILKRRREICLKNLRFLKSFKLQMAFRRYLRSHAPDIVKGSEYSSSYESDSSEEQPDNLMPKRKLAGLKKQKTDVQKLHYARYLKPSLRLLYVTLNKQADDFYTEKKKIYGFLHEMSKKNQIKILFKITSDTISTFQKLIRAYFKQKRLWEVMIRRGMEDEIPKLRDFIRQMKAGRDQYEWMIEELEDLGEEEGREYIDKVSKSMVQYLKDVHVLNVYRFQRQVLAKPVTADTLEGAGKFIKKSKREFFGAYKDDLDKFPSRLLVDGNVKVKDEVDAKKKKGGKKGGPDDGRQIIHLANVANAYKKQQTKAGGGDLEEEEDDDDDDRIVSLQEIEAIYAETGARFIPYQAGKTGSLLFDVPHPQINVLDNIQYFKRIPGTLMLNNNQIIQNNKKIKDKIYEVTQFRELIFYALLEQKKGKYAELMGRKEEEE